MIDLGDAKQQYKIGSKVQPSAVSLPNNVASFSDHVTVARRYYKRITRTLLARLLLRCWGHADCAQLLDSLAVELE